MNIFADEYARQFDAEARRLNSIFMNNTKRMGRLIYDLLSFSQLGRKELIRTQTSMTQMVLSICEEQKRAEIGRNIEFSVQELPDALVDTVTMRQVWINLISNAVKYTKHREKATVEIGAEERDEDHMYFIKDNGAGFECYIMTSSSECFSDFIRKRNLKAPV
jgi:light-regulated signal transduction histidine kinase (bacteriophytochrome)